MKVIIVPRISARNTHITTQLPLLLTVLLALLLAGCEAAKGGAKSVINRNRRQRTRGGHHGGGYHGDDAVEGGEHGIMGTGIPKKFSYLRLRLDV